MMNDVKFDQDAVTSRSAYAVAHYKSSPILRAKDCFLALMRCTIDTNHEDIDQRNWLLP